MFSMISRATKKLTIGRLSALAEVGVDTVRFYERRGLLPEPQRTASGYRTYDAATVDRLLFIRRAKNLGFSLDEIETLLTLQDKGGSKSVVKQLTRNKLDEIDQKIGDLTKMRKVLGELSNQCSGDGAVDGCPIIEALTDAGK